MMLIISQRFCSRSLTSLFLIIFNLIIHGFPLVSFNNGICDNKVVIEMNKDGGLFGKNTRPNTLKLSPTDEIGIGDVVLTNKKTEQTTFKHTRSNSLSSLWSTSRQNDMQVLSSRSRKDNLDKSPISSPKKIDSLKWYKSPIAVVTILLIEAKDIRLGSEEAANCALYCEFKLGTECHKSKYASYNSLQTEWLERFNIYLYSEHIMNITLRDKRKDKKIIGSCFLDLSGMEMERTHELKLKLDDGHGSLHFSVTVCSNSTMPSPTKEDLNKEKTIASWISNWNTIGQLHVVVHEARGLPVTGLSGKISAYCAVELDNERIQTPNANAYNTLHWSNTRYTFNIYDITSTLFVKVYNKSIMTTFKDETLGRVSIPLTRIEHGKTRWYALKDKSRRNYAKGNCPRISLEMYITWDVMKASLRLFRPKKYKYIKKPPKFDLGLVYNNLIFVKDTFNELYMFNQQIKDFLEWDDSIKCQKVLAVYLVFCYYFRPWMTPLLLIIPFIYGLYKILINNNDQDGCNVIFEEDNIKIEYTPNNDKHENDKSFSGKLLDLQDTTLTITKGIEYTASIYERLYNLTNFEVPFLAGITIVILVASTYAFYYIPFNYILMSLGIYKFGRKRLQPDRTPNNDVLDFISHIPDRTAVKSWKELDIPGHGYCSKSEKICFTIPMKDLQKDRDVSDNTQNSQTVIKRNK